MTETATAVSESVRRGYDALIAAGHTPEAIRDAVLGDDLDMARCDRCVIGNLYGLRDRRDSWSPFQDAVVALGGRISTNGAELGFNIDVDDDDDERPVDDLAYSALAAEWRRLAAEWRRLVTEMAEATS